MIDIFIPYYGDPAYLRLAVHSVLDQTDRDWRLVILDDNPPDVDDELAGWLAALGDDRIEYIRNGEHLGVSRAFQRCADLAQAHHVTILGCDDLLHPRYVEVVRRGHRRNPGADAVQPRVRVIDSDGEPSSPLGDRVKKALEPRGGGDHVLTGEQLATSLLRGAWHYFPAICWNRNALRRHGFRAGYETTPDLVLLLEIAVSGGAFVLLGETAFCYRRHAASASSVSARRVTRFEEESAVFGEFARRCHDLDWTAATRAARWHVTSRLHTALHAVSAYRHGRRDIARTLARIALTRTVAGTAPEPLGDTRDVAYAKRLNAGARWKRILRVQAPYEWNLRRYRLGRTLDVGCGVGRNLRNLPAESIGVDHNEHAIELARGAGLHALTIQEWNARGFADHSFDSLLLAHVVEHMDRARALDLLRAYTRFVRPGGKVLIICPQERGFASDPTHVEYFAAADLTGLARSAGLTVTSARSFPFPARVGRVFYANETVVLARTPTTPYAGSAGSAS